MGYGGFNIGEFAKPREDLPKGQHEEANHMAGWTAEEVARMQHPLWVEAVPTLPNYSIGVTFTELTPPGPSEDDIMDAIRDIGRS